MKKTFALLASLLMASSCASLPVSAYVVIAVDEDYPSCWVTQLNPNNQFMMYASDLADFNPTQEIFELGDIIEYNNVSILPRVDYGGTLTSSLYDIKVRKEDQPYSISKAGSIFDNPEIKQFTVTSCSKWNVDFKDDEENDYRYNIDWHTDGYSQPGYVDLTTLHSGDVVSCITYNGNPIIVTEVTSPAPPSGDANGDGTLDILDVIIVNQAILGKRSLTDTDKIYHVDFNQNGVPDAADALTMLKMIVGLE